MWFSICKLCEIKIIALVKNKGASGKGASDHDKPATFKKLLEIQNLQNKDDECE